MLIDGVGYDIKAMSQISESEFIKIHIDNDAIVKGRSKEEFASYMKGVHAQIKKKVADDAAAKDAAEKAKATQADKKDVA